MPKAKDAAMRAVQLDEQLAEAHAALAFIHVHYDWSWLDAEREFRRAIELNPGYATAHSSYARFLNVVGRFPEATESIRRAQELDPLAPGIATGFGLMWYFQRDYARAVEQYNKVLEIEPNYALARMNLGVAWIQMNKYAEAAAEFEKVRKLVPTDAGTMCDLAHVYGRMGRRSEAEALIAQVLELRKSRYVSPPFIAFAYLGIGDGESAFKWLATGVDERAWPSIFLRIDPRYDALRGDARFADVLRKVGL
jgi:serine/threonine-protein kinase